jgi:hypothetical protein
MSLYFGSEQIVLACKDSATGPDTDLFSKIIFGRLNSEVSADGRKDESPFN